jgi:hypothetical protein
MFCVKTWFDKKKKNHKKILLSQAKDGDGYVWFLRQVDIGYNGRFVQLKYRKLEGYAKHCNLYKDSTCYVKV